MASLGVNILCLSDEVLLMILCHLDIASSSQVQKVCPRLQLLCKDQALASDANATLHWIFFPENSHWFTMKVLI